MHPILFRLGPLTIHTYGALVALGFFTAITLAASEAKRKGMDPEKIIDLGVYIILAAIVGSRLLEVAVEYKFYLANPVEILKVWKGGLVFYGGFIGAVLTAVWYLRKHDLPVWKVGDTLAPCIALGHAIGRIGCFMAGCCYGAATCSPLGVTFKDPDSLAVLGVPVHPTQLYESFGNFLIFLGLYLYRGKTSFEGQLFWMYVMAYSALRFSVEFFRGDERGFLHVADFTLSTSQFIAIVAFMTATAMLSRLKTASRRKGAGTA